MIRIDLVDNTASVKHVDFQVVPVTTERDFTCIPDGILPLPGAVRLSREVKAGRTFGRMGKYLWYRLIGAPARTHKSPIGSHR
ncbi:MAG: hypothetical protein ABR915_24530 [Thermoguttaceae bacterium]|jgi:hypothetical protein